MAAYDSFSDDDLLAKGATLESELATAKSHTSALRAVIDEEESKARRQAARLGFSSVAAVGGVIIATGGLGILVALPGLALAAMDTQDMLQSMKRLRRVKIESSALVSRTAQIADELQGIAAEIERRGNR